MSSSFEASADVMDTPVAILSVIAGYVGIAVLTALVLVCGGQQLSMDSDESTTQLLGPAHDSSMVELGALADPEVPTTTTTTNSTTLSHQEHLFQQQLTLQYDDHNKQGAAIPDLINEPLPQQRQEAATADLPTMPFTPERYPGRFNSNPLRLSQNSLPNNLLVEAPPLPNSTLRNLPHNQTPPPEQQDDRQSAAPSVASTSRLQVVQQRQNREMPRPFRTWDLERHNSATQLLTNQYPALVGANQLMRWSFRQPVGRSQSMRRMVQQERLSALGGGTNNNNPESGSVASRSRSSWNSRTPSRAGGAGAAGARMSDVASNVLDGEEIEGEAEFYRQRYIQRSTRQRQQRYQRPGPPSITSSRRSHMSPLSPDVLSPEDAADANDPGVLNTYLPPPEPPEEQWSGVCAPLGVLISLAEPDDEVRRIVALAAPSTLGAVADPFFRMGMVAIISHFIDAESMVAYVLVMLFLRITTEELSGALTDAQSTMLHQALSLGGDHGLWVAGQYIQLALLMQIIFSVPILAVWALMMESVISWLVPENETIATLAAEYTSIIVIEFALQGLGRSFMLVFHMTGQSQFELNIDLCATALTIAAIAVSSSRSAEPSLESIAWIQLIVGVAKLFVKVGYIILKGWMEPYRAGLFGGIPLRDRGAVTTFLAIFFPLLMGSLIELREWEILTLFIRHLGGTQVATWTLMGIVWELFEASIEGIGEASAVRVSFLLSENLPGPARQLSHKTILLCLAYALISTAVFLIIGPNLSVALTQDSTLQHLFDELVGTTALASVVMSMAQFYWSLLGAQGRFDVASSSILMSRWFVTMPLGIVCVFVCTYDLLAVAACIAVGYATATVVMAWRLFQSNWKGLALTALEEAAPHDDGDIDLESVDEEDEEEEEESEDDSSTGFG